MDIVKRQSEKIFSGFIFELANRKFSLDFTDTEIYTPVIYVISGSAEIIYNENGKQIELQIKENDIKDISFLENKVLFVQSGPTGISWLGFRFLDGSKFTAKIFTFNDEIIIDDQGNDAYYFSTGDTFFYKNILIQENNYIFQPSGKSFSLNASYPADCLKLTKSD